MDFVIDPPIADKIARMKKRVQWQGAPIRGRGIDQTALVLDDGQPEEPEFSFLVVGDSGSGPHRGHNPQRQIAEQMLTQREDCRFVLHTGDVMYLVGSDEYYPKNFIQPYREFLVGGERPEQIAYDRMVFNQPFLPIPGNHDYYDLPFFYGLVAQTMLPLRQLLGFKLDLDVGWRGSDQGKVYAKAFLDYLKAFESDAELGRHLDRHYTARTATGRCLRYRPGAFTRLPNRYYTFRAGGIDFFALDSNTFNAPTPLASSDEGEASRRDLEHQRAELEIQKQQMLEMSDNLEPDEEEASEQLEELRTKIEQLEEMKMDLDKQLHCDPSTVTDFEQLEWLTERLAASWNDPSVRGRVIYMHHPPYVTEATKWQQAQTLAVRRRLRRVLDAVHRQVGERAKGRPLVDAIFTGHAHCLEHLRTADTGHADAHLDIVICGGSGFSLRRQRPEGPVLTEEFGDQSREVARSQLFVGRDGVGGHKRRPYSFLRVDVEGGTPPRLVVRPFIAEQYLGRWMSDKLAPFDLGRAGDRSVQGR
ncbi:metallophosphoesterase [Gloeobacter violaceus]|uniref:Glr2510 protein n=1 Tax=Gloeobacter violaceus (strain ATCC 29082 / PCC 7421) TaxID=251221 RepID=Q7NHM5_GLOVI|nr:metallophosphoesterase [Gloeobacter violaceus]BAC90451.1 glr2510 [Gloeobacter violaceus PCC 7421]